MNHKNTFQTNRWLPLASALLLAACATTGDSPEGAVAERAQARWDTLLAEDIEGAYAYLSPGYRSGYSLLDYYRKLGSMRVKWTDAQVKESNCSESSCKIQISVDYVAYGAVPGVQAFPSTTLVEEDWVQAGGEWYLLPGN